MPTVFHEAAVLVGALDEAPDALVRFRRRKGVDPNVLGVLEVVRGVGGFCPQTAFLEVDARDNPVSSAGALDDRSCSAVHIAVLGVL